MGANLHLNQIVMDYRDSTAWLQQLSTRIFAFPTPQNQQPLVPKLQLGLGASHRTQTGLMMNFMESMAFMDKHLSKTQGDPRPNGKMMPHAFVTRLMVRHLAGDGLSQQQIDQKVQFIMQQSKERFHRLVEWSYQKGKDIATSVGEQLPLRISLTPEAEKSLKQKMHQLEPKGKQLWNELTQQCGKILQQSAITSETRTKIENDLDNGLQKLKQITKRYARKLASKYVIEGGLTQEQLNLIKARRREQTQLKNQQCANFYKHDS